MGTDRDGLDSILAGNEEGAKGCCLSVDMTSDGIAVLSSDGYVLAPNGGAVAVCDHTYTELRKVAPRLLPVGQALDLARACRSKIAITLRDPSLLPQMRMTLRQTDYLDDAVFVGLGLVEAARLAAANPDLHIMGEMPAVPDNIAALVNASQTTGLFGRRAGSSYAASAPRLPRRRAVYHESADERPAHARHAHSRRRQLHRDLPSRPRRSAPARRQKGPAAALPDARH